MLDINEMRKEKPEDQSDSVNGHVSLHSCTVFENVYIKDGRKKRRVNWPAFLVFHHFFFAVFFVEDFFFAVFFAPHLDPQAIVSHPLPQKTP